MISLSLGKLKTSSEQAWEK